MNTGFPRSPASDTLFPSSVVPAIAGAGLRIAPGVAAAVATSARSAMKTASVRMRRGYRYARGMWDGLTTRLEGRVVTVEPLAVDHEPGLYAAAQDMDWSLMPIDPSGDAGRFHRWLEDALALAERGEQFPFAVLDAKTGEPLGSTRYLSLRPEHRGLEIGWTWLTRQAWGTGANIEAKLLLLTRAFEHLGCMRVEFKTDATNERSRRALAALPAEFEGVSRKHMLAGNDGTRLRDSAWYAIVDTDWPAVKSNLEQRLMPMR